MRALQDSWRERLGSVRRGSAADLLLRALPGAPLLTATTASDLVGRSFQATSQAIDRLVEAGVLKQVTVGRRNRAFEAPELIEAFTALELGSSRAPKETPSSCGRRCATAQRR